MPIRLRSQPPPLAATDSRPEADRANPTRMSGVPPTPDNTCLEQLYVATNNCSEAPTIVFVAAEPVNGRLPSIAPVQVPGWRHVQARALIRPRDCHPVHDLRGYAEPGRGYLSGPITVAVAPAASARLFARDFRPARISFAATRILGGDPGNSCNWGSNLAVC